MLTIDPRDFKMGCNFEFEIFMFLYIYLKNDDSTYFDTETKGIHLLFQAIKNTKIGDFLLFLNTKNLKYT